MKTRLRKASRNFSIPQQLIWPRKQTQACGLIAESPQALIAEKMNQAMNEAQPKDCHSRPLNLWALGSWKAAKKPLRQLPARSQGKVMKNLLLPGVCVIPFCGVNISL